MAVIRTISLQQPWASLLAIGAKRIETRSWRTDYRGPLAIHASRRLSRVGRESLASEEVQRALSAAGVGPDALPLGCVLAVCVLEKCVGIVAPPPEPERSFGDYRPGRYAWMLADVRALRRPLPARGRLGLWWCTIDDAELGDMCALRPVANAQQVAGSGAAPSIVRDSGSERSPARRRQHAREGLRP